MRSLWQQCFPRVSRAGIAEVQEGLLARTIWCEGTPTACWCSHWQRAICWRAASLPRALLLLLLRLMLLLALLVLLLVQMELVLLIVLLHPSSPPLHLSKQWLRRQLQRPLLARGGLSPWPGASLLRTRRRTASAAKAVRICPPRQPWLKSKWLLEAINLQPSPRLCRSSQQSPTCAWWNSTAAWNRSPTSWLTLRRTRVSSPSSNRDASTTFRSVGMCC
mmetsp:Transcript_35327/g.53108  ORF Transcript_35327/g.53108 Transcript_35327/m.53108 type:complete len:220 (-) Transcript_35327:137-796(-)